MLPCRVALADGRGRNHARIIVRYRFTSLTTGAACSGILDKPSFVWRLFWCSSWSFKVVFQCGIAFLLFSVEDFSGECQYYCTYASWWLLDVDR